MRIPRVVAVAGLFLTPDVSAQTSACSSSDEALRDVAHQFWAAYNRHDPAALDRVLDDRLLFVGIQGTPATKAQFLGELRTTSGSITSGSAERMDDVRTIAAGEVAVVSFRRQWTLTFTSVGISDTAYSRMTETLVCRSGQWRVLAFQETVIPNATRAPNAEAASRYDDYVGRYRFGDGGEITVTRRGNQLFEAWGKDEPIEILPGQHGSFFTRGFSWVERFLRDQRGRVTGIHYTFENGEREAKRIP